MDFHASSTPSLINLGFLMHFHKESLLSEFPANTNILYVDLHSAEQVASRNDDTSLPGLVLNIKKQIEFIDQCGITRRVSGGRLECTMQNIADNFCNTYGSRYYGVKEADHLDTYIVYDERRRVTSSAKKKRKHGNNSLHQLRNLEEIRVGTKSPKSCSSPSTPLSGTRTSDSRAWSQEFSPRSRDKYHLNYLRGGHDRNGT